MSKNSAFTASLFPTPNVMQINNGAYLLKGYALNYQDALLHDLRHIIDSAPLRHMQTPGGYTMSVAMTNCGTFGWVSDKSGYRYSKIDPIRDMNWPSMPESFLRLAQTAASEAGYHSFAPDACLINRYEPGARLTLHQDKNERDFDAPIVSVSIGVPATFLFGGMKRKDKTKRIHLEHGDIMVWGGPSRLCYHGVLPLKEQHHPLTGGNRFNLTFRKAN